MRRFGDILNNASESCLAALDLAFLEVEVGVYQCFGVLHILERYRAFRIWLYLRLILLLSKFGLFCGQLHPFRRRKERRIRLSRRPLPIGLKVLSQNSENVGLQFGLLSLLIDSSVKFVDDEAELLVVKGDFQKLTVIVLSIRLFRLFVDVGENLFAALKVHLVKVVLGVVLSLSVQRSQLLHY